ncbi:mannose-1-phosphate guanylyltransferase [Noviherbaspirillum aridicola]|uniref:Mannose-1-phosphate guanylyltransferase n=1 Tax=Noviherbaspirillum aridicola TaxID=2849687 RepID=A0ABQ4Q8F9_9BURK|nr:mannose-1-phosphate guanylyltransferase [Noviherbaspirillum aridicola]
MRPLTYDLPKPMIPILGKPVMAYIVEHLAACGVKDIMVNVSWLHEKIESYFGEGRRFGVRIGYSFEGYVDGSGEVVAEALGSAGGMKKIQEFGRFFDETTIVLCGDAIIDLDIQAAVAEHKRKGAMASVITREVPWDKVSDYGVVVADGDGKIQKFQEKPKQEEALSNLVSTGIYIFEPEAIDLIPSGQVFDIGSQLFPLMAEKGLPFYAQKHEFQWLDIGSVTDYWSVLQSVLTGEVPGMEVPGAQIRDGVWVGLNTRIEWEGTTIEGPVYIGAGCHIEAGSRIVGPTWIGHGSHVCAGAEVHRSVLFEYTRVLPGTKLEEAIVCGDYSVDRKGNMVRIDEDDDIGLNNARDRRILPRTDDEDAVVLQGRRTSVAAEQGTYSYSR